jgi:uncharacterized protein YeeX (DUF496 family)
VNRQENRKIKSKKLSLKVRKVSSPQKKENKKILKYLTPTTRKNKLKASKKKPERKTRIHAKTVLILVN